MQDAGSLPIASPLLVNGASSLDWQDECDVLVVGLGAAGACAAIEAAGAGVSVMIVAPVAGGRVRLGPIWAAGPT